MPPEDQKIDPQLLNAVARSFWVAGYKVENPDATQEETQAAWKDAAADYRKVVRIALRRLSAQGVTLNSQAGADTEQLADTDNI